MTDGSVLNDAAVLPCGVACESPTPVCDESTSTCVACLDDTDCSDSSPRCDTTTNTCGPCTESTQCAARSDDTPLCDTDGGACVQCLQTSDCDGTSCNPRTQACTESAPGSVGICEPCEADEDCITVLEVGTSSITVDVNCVRMNFDGSAHGDYCLITETTSSGGECENTSGNSGPGDLFAVSGSGNGNRPFTTTVTRDTLSGEQNIAHCTLNESNTTCEAFLSTVDETPITCSTAADCAPNGDGALCTTVNGTDNRCSYPCDDNPECPGGFGCGGSTNTCGGS